MLHSFPVAGGRGAVVQEGAKEVRAEEAVRDDQHDEGEHEDEAEERDRDPGSATEAALLHGSALRKGRASLELPAGDCV
jgi:hypothetical protein